MDNTLHRFFAPCPRGLEPVLEQELRELGLSATTRTEGGIAFQGLWNDLYRVNLESRIASRVLWEVGRDTYLSERDVYKAAYALPWPDWFAPERTIKVKVSARGCSLPSLDFLTLRIKDAVCDKFVSICRRRPTVDTRRPHIRIDAFLDAETVTFYLDTSGDALFKRGYRRSTVEAPLRENLAAGLLRLSGWTPQEALLDPMCGGGTIPLEAALMARRIAPGLGRTFAFEILITHDPERWRSLQKAAQARRLAEPPAPIHASDRNPQAVRIARETFRKAGVADDVFLAQADILDVHPPTANGIMLINPPYGVRLSRPDELEAFYRKLGDHLKRQFAGWRVYVFTGDLRVPKLIGLAPTKRLPLFNGSIECRLYEFLLVSGSMRKYSRARRGDGDSLAVS